MMSVNRRLLDSVDSVTELMCNQGVGTFSLPFLDMACSIVVTVATWEYLMDVNLRLL
jgi:hypothetical protein